MTSAQEIYRLTQSLLEDLTDDHELVLSIRDLANATASLRKNSTRRRQLKVTNLTTSIKALLTELIGLDQDQDLDTAIEDLITSIQYQDHLNEDTGYSSGS